MSYNVSDDSIEERKRLLQIAENQRDADLKYLLNHPSGIRFIKDLFTEAHIFTTTFTGSSQGMFLEGKRDLALKVLRRVRKLAPNKVVDLMTEEEDVSR